MVYSTLKRVINGTATLNINLYPGDYIITTMYGKYAVGNNVTVLPTLITKDLDMKFQDGSNFTANFEWSREGKLHG